MKIYCLIAPFNSKAAEKIKKEFIKNEIKPCKVGTLVGVPEDKRFKFDKLPYHITLCIWAKADKALINNLEIRLKKHSPLNLNFDSFDFFNKDENILFFKPEKNDALAKLQKDVYTITQNDYFPPDKWKPHATFMINNNKEEFDNARKLLKTLFVPFEIKIDHLILCEAYPFKIIKKIKLL